MKYNCNNIIYIFPDITSEIILQKTGNKTIDFNNINEPYPDKKLTISMLSNDNVLPIGLEELYLYINQNEILSSDSKLFSLTNLKILETDYIIYNDDIVKLPNSLEILKCKINVRTSNLESIASQMRIYNLNGYKFPDNIKQLDVIWYTSNYQDQIIFPSNLETLKIKISKPITFTHLPNTIKILDLSADCRIYYEKLPDSLEVIYLDDEFNRSTDIFSNCKNLKKISFGKNFNKSIKFLPDSVQEIELGTSFCQKIAKIPSSLKSIKFCKKHATYYKFAKDFPHISIL